MSSARVSTQSTTATSQVISGGKLTAESCTPCAATNAKASPCHLYAQQLNNSAALCIEVGQYSRAIASLQKALELNKSPNKGWKDRGEEVCRCYHCTLDACIAYSENTPTEATTEIHGHKFCQNNKKRRKICFSPKKYSAFWKPPANNQQQTSLPLDKENNDQVDVSTCVPINASSLSSKQPEQECRHVARGNGSNSGGYIYRRPIRIKREGHAMGSTLYLIVTFNLALAHHLQLVSRYANKNVERSSKEVNRTLVLYELSYKWQLKLLNNSSSKRFTTRGVPLSPPPSTAVTSIRFNMMIRNNLSEIHRLVGNHAKHKRCLEHLLSTVMVVTEYKSRSAMNRVISNSIKDPRQMELDGFLQNTTELILQEGHCANAA